MSADPHRPTYHFLPPANWMNDPNGLIQWGDTYHLFYQYNPDGPFHARIHWGHATSLDLVHWQHEPIALAPTPDGPDGDGCWSGCAVDNNGTPTLVYTAYRDGAQTTCLATSQDGLRSWQKYPANPVIAMPPAGLDLLGFRDHSVWRENGLWQMLIGSGLRGQGGTALLYRSPDLRDWQYTGSLLIGDLEQTEPVWTGTMWECPDFFALAGRHVMIAAAWDGLPLYSFALVGSYEHERFVPDTSHKLDHGDVYFYAPQSFTTRQGRRIMFGWISEGRSAAEQHAAGWAGVMSLPRELVLNEQGQVAMRPVEELALLRAAHIQRREQTVPADGRLQLPELRGDALELLVELQPGAHGGCGLVLRCAPDGSEETLITYWPEIGQLVVDRSHSSLDSEVVTSAHSAPLTLKPGEPLQLRVFLDRSVLEIFANDRAAITTRIYPSRPDSHHVALLAHKNAARLIALDAWQLKSIW